MAIINLSKGAVVGLTKGIQHLKVDLSWTPSKTAQEYDLDIMALELDEDGIIIDADKDDCKYLVFYNCLSDKEEAVIHSGDDRTGEGDGEEMNVFISKLNPEVKSIVFVLNIFKSKDRHQNFGEIKNIKVRIYQDDEALPSLVYNLEEDSSHSTATVLKVISIYKSKSGAWTVKAINEGVTSTLTGVLKSYGVTTNDSSI